MEEIAEIPELSGPLREFFWTRATLNSSVVKTKKDEGAKFADYFEYDESINKIPSHRALALFRGSNDGVLRLNLDLPEQDSQSDNKDTHPCVSKIAAHLEVTPSSKWLFETIRKCWIIKLHTRFETELRQRLRESAEAEAIDVFAKNLRDLLLAAPAGLSLIHI